MKLSWLVQSNAQMEYNKKSSMSHEHLAFIRPKTPLRPIDGSIWRSTFFFSICQIYKTVDFELLLSLFVPQRILWNLCPAQLLIPWMLLGSPGHLYEILDIWI